MMPLWDLFVIMSYATAAFIMLGLFAILILTLIKLGVVLCEKLWDVFRKKYNDFW